MAVTLKQMENTSSTFPDAPLGLSEGAAALDPDMIWSRIENYVAHRWTVRGLKWIAEGPGEWCFPLTPVVEVTAFEQWIDGAWEAVTPVPSPLGGYELPDGTFRIKANVGEGDPPAPVLEAFRRLAEYAKETDDKAGASDHSVSIGSELSEAYTRPSNWMAKAMQLSGAADLLRPYRRA